MKIKRVRLIYFSATNTTQTVVRRIGAKLSECLDVPVQENDFTLPKAREQDILCQSEELAVVGVPVYAGRVPNKLLPYVRDAIHGSDTLAVPVVLYGNRDYDDALIELRDVLESNGFRTIAGAAFVGEHSFSRILAAADRTRRICSWRIRSPNALPTSCKPCGSFLQSRFPSKGTRRISRISHRKTQRNTSRSNQWCRTPVRLRAVRQAVPARLD